MGQVRGFVYRCRSTHLISGTFQPHSPHRRNTFPRTHEIMEDILGDLPPKVQADISALTCARLYDIELPDDAYAVAAE